MYVYISIYIYVCMHVCKNPSLLKLVYDMLKAFFGIFSLFLKIEKKKNKKIKMLPPYMHPYNSDEIKKHTEEISLIRNLFIPHISLNVLHKHAKIYDCTD